MLQNILLMKYRLTKSEMMNKNRRTIYLQHQYKLLRIYRLIGMKMNILYKTMKTRYTDWCCYTICLLLQYKLLGSHSVL